MGIAGSWVGPYRLRRRSCHFRRDAHQAAAADRRTRPSRGCAAARTEGGRHCRNDRQWHSCRREWASDGRFCRRGSERPPRRLKGASEMSQLSYVHGASNTPFIGDAIGVHFDRIVERFSDRDALIVRHQQIRWTYRELKERVDAFAAGLLALGLKRGDRIGVWSPNNAEWVIAQFATAKAGLILVNINPAYRVTELEYALNKAGCVALITATQFKSSDYLAMLAELAPELRTATPGNLSALKLPNLRLVINIGANDAPGIVRFDDVSGLARDAEWHRLAALA